MDASCTTCHSPWRFASTCLCQCSSVAATCHVSVSQNALNFAIACGAWRDRRWRRAIVFGLDTTHEPKTPTTQHNAASDYSACCWVDRNHEFFGGDDSFTIPSWFAAALWCVGVCDVTHIQSSRGDDYPAAKCSDSASWTSSLEPLGGDLLRILCGLLVSVVTECVAGECIAIVRTDAHFRLRSCCDRVSRERDHSSHHIARGYPVLIIWLRLACQHRRLGS